MTGDAPDLRADIEQTRAALGETVQALAAKVDVKARLQETADDARARVRDGLRTAAVQARSAAADAPRRTRQLAIRAGAAARDNPVPLAVVAGSVAALALFVRWRRNR
ncbi:MAG: hypothetical protein QOI74_3355 [Micromonosporaceae bacterium]|jgi:hypothetical protein|nr:hypothetical protein [Micromonosporaceae bacterium]MDT5038203.1 hypothetical protein [Micromonosporaceae bacterium]